MNKEKVLEVTNLNKSFGKTKIIDSLNLQVEKGDIYGFLGPNGSGKTTTIRMVLGLVHFQQGEIKLNGYDIKRDYKRAIKKVGAVVEMPKFYENYSGYQNLKMMASFYNDLPKNRIEEVLEIVGMKKRAKGKVKTYSLGMKQRMGIAMALLNKPEVVILDEPTNGLDPQGMKEIREMIVQLSLEQDITFFISTHLLHEVEQICNKVVILKQGKKLAEGTVNELLNSSLETIKIHTSAPEKAIKTLKKQPSVQSSEIEKDGIKIIVTKGSVEQIVNVLVLQSIPVEYVIPLNQSLENYFIKLTEGGEHIA